MTLRLLTLSIFVLGFVSLFSFTSSSSAETLQQCMTKCVQYEGNTADAKDTCKARCANVVAQPQTSNNNQPSCMSVYKKCNRSCGSSNTTCQRDCKEALLDCR